MKKILVCMALVGCFSMSCTTDAGQETLTYESSRVSNEVQGPLPKSNRANLSEVEKSFQAKIARMSGDEFRYELENYSEEQLKNFAIEFLIEDSYKVLLENDYTETSIKEEFADDQGAVVLAAMNLYYAKMRK